MTAVAAPPSVQSVSRLGCYSSSNGEQDVLPAPSADEVSRMLMPRKSIQRTNSSSSLSSSSTVSAHSQPGNAEQTSGSDSTNGSSKKKPSRYIWSSSKAEPVAGVTNARPHPVSAPPSSTTASSAMSALHQPSPMVPSQHMLQSPQQNGVRGGGRQAPNEPTALLSLTPLNGTFERKQIHVPYFPEVLRIGRQTNGKTVPTSSNGYFDSKVLSRQHAEVWADRAGKIWIRDVKSSNGTFVNGERLSSEGRDSEPHEVREHDTLELGIDIISEDQKCIVHHKVSAKVDHAGIYGPNMNIMDLNFGDIDPTAGGGLLPSHLNQPSPHMRNRQGSTGSVGSNRSAVSSGANQLNVLQQQRQMNYWHSPISIEQVVKKLTSEMRHAKEQSYDLNTTSGFMSSLNSPDRQEKEKTKPPAPPGPPPPARQVNGRPKGPRLDTLSRFSDPPAPPPKQPLPEKPDVPPRSSPSDASGNVGLKRSDTEKPKLPNASPSSARESSQILSLVEALSSAKKELDSQGARVKELEDLLHKERVARENAEERAQKLESRTPLQDGVSEVDAAFEPPSEDHEAVKPQDDSALVDANKEKPSSSPGTTDGDSFVDDSARNMQQRLDVMVAEMEEMRKEVERHKDSAQRAQADAAESRKTLAEMVENIRRDREQTSSDATEREDNKPALDITHTRGTEKHDDDEMVEGRSGKFFGSSGPPGSVTAHTKKLDGGPLTEQRHRNQMLEQSAPYASMLGVVLLGVGIMTYLNGWQRGDK